MELLYFILGVIFASYISPILDGAGALFLTWVEVKKAQMSEKISLIEINLRRKAEEEPPRRQIGFCVPDDDDEEENPEEENDDEI
jgi:hypothetical protein